MFPGDAHSHLSKALRLTFNLKKKKKVYELNTKEPKNPKQPQMVSREQTNYLKLSCLVK